VGEGWHVSLTTLMNERVSIGGQVSPRGSGVIGVAMNQWKRTAQKDAVARNALTQLWIEAEVNRLTNMRASHTRAKGTPGPEGSVGKLAMAGLNQRIMSFTMDLMGAEGMLYPTGYPMDRPRTAMDLSNAQKAFLRVQANSIEGGTTNIMKNILGERVLGLPGEPRADKDLPWSQVPRS
jgi:alkylation response protein AidB-like acyl-CoA dehydrogenase